MVKQQKNIRLPEITLQKIEALKASTGMTDAEVVMIALDRLTAQELKRKAAERASQPAADARREE